ncbi:penicillin acylase family protein [Bartonella sp. HY406]|uniref:penicillin acylase family protein n=1 Tax=Bartonella sp. HY406 TaxID=2979331 RepID=UPI0021C7DF69|nr:penicillin acylase family protein [Bartonella sp. HY406]UXN02781.1 penicillin acylase family protein [Bartonella sp. HY406]
MITPIELQDIHADASITVDDSGVAHINAQNRDDLFFLQGWNAARDRLWQIDLWRKRGLGLLARDFGAGYLKQDRAARLFLYRGNMAEEFACYGDHAHEICQAFVKGINSYINGIKAGSFKLPPEFLVFDTFPDFWQAEDVVRIRSHSLTRNASSETLRAKILSLATDIEIGEYVDMLRQNLEPAISISNEDSDVYLDDFANNHILNDFFLALAPVSFDRKRMNARLDEADDWGHITSAGKIGGDKGIKLTGNQADSEVIGTGSSLEGSNNWAIASKKSAIRRPILALDPHRTHNLPSVRYVVHLTMPQLDIIGAGEPCVPGISMGHNGFASFALTIFYADQEDIYCYDMAPSKSTHYIYQGQEEALINIEETIEVKNYPAQKLFLQFTKHGPVIFQNSEHKKVYAIKTVWLDAGMAPYMASLAVMNAKTPDDYLNGLKKWGTPSVNHIYADCNDNIIWKPAGAFPIRHNWAGLLPISGNGMFEWSGYADPSTTPMRQNPPSGFLATANAMNINETWLKNHSAIGFEWLDVSRSKVIHQFLEEKDKIGLDDCAKLQNSTLSYTVTTVQSLIQSIKVEQLTKRESRLAFDILCQWNGDLSKSSNAAALFEIWFNNHLGAYLTKAKGADQSLINLAMPFDTASLRLELAKIAKNNIHYLVLVLDETLKTAFEEATNRLGADYKAWQWGELHQLRLQHPLQHFVDDDWSIADIELGGSATSPNMAAYNVQNYQVTTGPSVRMIIDVGQWDNSLFINTPGQSGNPDNEHYQDLKDDWQSGQYRQLLYSSEAIKKAAKVQYLFKPK